VSRNGPAPGSHTLQGSKPHAAGPQVASRQALGNFCRTLQGFAPRCRAERQRRGFSTAP